MDSSASVGVVFLMLRVITSFFLFLVSSTYADNSSALQSPDYCFDQGENLCLLSVEYPLEFPGYSDKSCGYPGFEVDCSYQSGERPYINISNHIYHVLQVDYKYKFIALVDTDVEGSGCPQPKRNFSFPSSPSWVNYELFYPFKMTIFYNCSRVLADAERHLLCSKQDTNTPPSYAFYDRENREGFDWYGNCAQNVVVPVLYNSGDGFNYSDAIKRGFAMSWFATDWCEDCERSGGQCWSNSTATGCACRNGKSYNTTCPRQLTPPPHQGSRRTPPLPPRHQGLRTGLEIGSGCSCVFLWKCFPHTLLKNP